MRIALAGGSGMLGGALREALAASKDDVVALVRRPARAGDAAVQWDPYAQNTQGAMAIPEKLEGLDAAVILSGENLSEGRWTQARKERFGSSRVAPTRQFATLLAERKSKPRVLVCASATGVYGDRGDEILTETSEPGHGFLPQLCQDWEAAAEPARAAGIRVVHLRLGVILSGNGGALKRMLPVFRLGLGGRLGSGTQWISWISLPDAVAAIRFAIKEEALRGAANTVAPEPVTNAGFTQAMGQVLHRPAMLRVPAFALKAAFGEMAEATILSSARVFPVKLEEAGFRFRYARLENALQNALVPGKRNATGLLG